LRYYIIIESKQTKEKKMTQQTLKQALDSQEFASLLYTEKETELHNKLFINNKKHAKGGSLKNSLKLLGYK
jgi:hypothetical protein